MSDTKSPDQPAPIQQESALGQAIRIWRSGRHINFHLAAALRADGYDVGTLARRHRPV